MWKKINIRFTPREHEKLARKAKKENRSIADIIRTLVDKHVK